MRLRFALFVLLFVPSIAFAGKVEKTTCNTPAQAQGKCSAAQAGANIAFIGQGAREHSLPEICEGLRYFEPFVCTEDLVTAGDCSGGEVGSVVTRPTETCNTGLVNSGRCRSVYQDMEIPDLDVCLAFIEDALTAILQRWRQEGREAAAARLASPITDEDIEQ